MAFVRMKDRVLEKSTTSGSGPFTLAGSGIDTSYNAFNSAGMSVGDTTHAVVVEPGVAFWSGVVTYSAANQITLTTVYESKGTFGSGTKEIFMGLPASRGVYKNPAGDIAHDGAIGAGGTPTTGKFQAFDTANPDYYLSYTGTAAAGNKGKIAFTHLRNSDGAQEQIGYIQGVAVDNQSTGGVRMVARNGSDVEVWKGTSTAFALSVPVTMAAGKSITTAASATGSAGFNLPTGVAPTSPADGDMWNDGTDVKTRVGSTTRTLTPRAPTQQRLLSGSGATYTRPTDCLYIRVREGAAGGGGGGSGNSGSGGTGTTGGDTSFGSFTTKGGVGGVGNATGAALGGAGGTGGSGTGLRLAGEAGSNSAVNNGGVNKGADGGRNAFFGGAGKGGVNSSGGAAVPNTGCGGGGGYAIGTGTMGGTGGGAGESLEFIIVNPAATYTYTVGTGGTGGAAGTSGNAGGAGGDGIIVVDEFYN